MTRRDFCGLAMGSVAGVVMPGCLSVGLKRWYRGSLHTHTYWSDGRGFPEDCVSAYKSLGYDFVAITDHNRIGTDVDYWRDVEPEDGHWPPAVNQRVFDHYVRTYAHAKTRRSADGKMQVRIQPLDETIRRFSEPERFLVMKGVELTYTMEGTNRFDVHMNCLNVSTVIPDVACDNLIANRPGQTVAELIARSYEAYRKSLIEMGSPPSLFVVNHPHWPMLDVTHEDLLSRPEVRFFEVCNNGTDFPMPSGIVDDGWQNDRLWDVVNAMRARRGHPLLYGVGSDDAHWYPGNGHERKPHMAATPGDSWISVRATSLTPEALFEAMDFGDFYVSCGVDLEDVSFDGQTLSVRVPPKPGVSYTVRFIVSKRGFPELPVRTAEHYFQNWDNPKGRLRRFPVFSPEIGQTVKCVTSRPGAGLDVSHMLGPDDLYVRARIESDETAICAEQLPAHPKVRCAWTQPYQYET